MIKLWFHITDDYRQGRNIYTYLKPPRNECEEPVLDSESDDEEDTAPEEACEIAFELPTETEYRFYIVNEFPEYKVVAHEDFDDDEKCDRYYLKIFSQIHNCLPFVVTGWTSSYKDEGHYPDVPDDIRQMPDIPLPDTILDMGSSEVYFAVVLDCDGNEVFTKLLNYI